MRDDIAAKQSAEEYLRYQEEQEKALEERIIKKIMFKLPENKRKEPKETPRTFLIWGSNMSGKSYLADRFPNALTLSTDGNAEKKGVPNVRIENTLDKNGKLVKSAYDQIEEILIALKTQKHPYETIVLDQIEGILGRIETAIITEAGVDSLSDIPFGKGWAMNKAAQRQMFEWLNDLNMNVVFISHQDESTDMATQQVEQKPMLTSKQYALVAASADLVIQTRRVGKNYIRRVTDRRKSYLRDQVDDPKILRILDNVTGAFDKAPKITRQEAEKIARDLEAKEVATATEQKPETPAAKPAATKATPVKPAETKATPAATQTKTTK